MPKNVNLDNIIEIVFELIQTKLLIWYKYCVYSHSKNLYSLPNPLGVKSFCFSYLCIANVTFPKFMHTSYQWLQRTQINIIYVKHYHTFWNLFLKAWYVCKFHCSFGAQGEPLGLEAEQVSDIYPEPEFLVSALQVQGSGTCKSRTIIATRILVTSPSSVIMPQFVC